MADPRTHQERAERVAELIDRETQRGTAYLSDFTSTIAWETFPTELVQAARRLLNEVYANLGAFELAMREAVGNTNYSVMAMRTDELKAALAFYPDPEQETP